MAERGINSTKLAAMIDVKPSTVRALLSRRDRRSHHLDTIGRIAQALGAGVDEIAVSTAGQRLKG
jgi:plasmid maintenance system antidote protein VapI